MPLKLFGMKNNGHENTKFWDPEEIFQCPANYNYGIIVLNQPILLDKNLVLPMWKQAQIRTLVDGGTNRWIEYLGDLADKLYDENCHEYRPDLVTGDWDSITSDVLEKMKKISTVIHTWNQNYNDFSKALIELSTECKRREIKLNAVYVLVENAGRFDHNMGNMNTLYMSNKFIDHVDKIIIISSNSLTWLLRPGKHSIKIPEVLIKNESWVGLIPLGSPANNISTTGLKWNLNNSALAFGDKVSTSNTYDGSPEVTVTADQSIIWSMGIEPLVE